MPRTDVIEAVRSLADARLRRRWADGDETWPGLTDAVHWLIDDTGYDQTPAIRDLGSLWKTETEAIAVQAVVDAIVPVLLELGPAASDDAYVSHPRWGAVVSASSAACVALGVG